MRRNLVMCAVVPLMVAFGVAVGYTVAGFAGGGTATPAAHTHAAAPGSQHDHATPGHQHETSPAPATSAGHTHDMPGMSDADMAAPAPAATHQHAAAAVSHQDGGDGPGTPAATRTAVVAGFAAVNVAILGAAALVRRRTRRGRPVRRPAVPAL
ncbi:hypothetical protein [Nucisporomicrobium flavum]|uniref:hypothetical protein n=1 Tax=Nucisporomicrobium flavum TaxID=2785915 RepID=UPI0018F4131A|nr:hypothetical protein [Nucisporomicrobium flavum]